MIHRPSFETDYEAFWDEITLGIEPPGSLQALVFAVFFCAIVSMNEATIARDFGAMKANLVENFKLGTETALARANFLRTTKVQTLQALVIYLVSDARRNVVQN